MKRTQSEEERGRRRIWPKGKGRHNEITARQVSPTSDQLGEALRESSTMRALVGLISAPLLLCGSDGRIAFGNERAAAFFGISQEALFGQHLLEMTASQPDLQHALQAVWPFPTPSFTQTIALTTASGPQWCEVRAVYTGEDERGWWVMFRDVTLEHRLAEQLARAEQLSAVSELAAGVVHEARNPLTTVRGFTEMLAEQSNKSVEVRRYYDLMLQELDAALDILNDFLQLSRSGTAFPVATERFSLRQILCSMLTLFETYARQHNVTLIYALPEDPLEMVGNARRGRQIFLNLLRNAVEAMPNGGKIRIDGEIANDWYRIRIADTGPGLTEIQKVHLFEPFYTTKEAGTGMGLAVAKQIAEEHGGTIALDETYTAGACFVVALPHAQPAQLSDVRSIAS
ncbi:MAG: PAS domain-containing protein [Firmicutes bacterium]|nr:PAS domain-containing protein [Bacillota bacterium]